MALFNQKTDEEKQEERRAKAQQEARDKYLASPVGKAEAAYQAGQMFFQLTMNISQIEGRSSDLRVAVALFEEALDWLRECYGHFDFWVERDLVWTVQTRLCTLISERSLPFQVFNDYPMLAGARRARSADLVIRNAGKETLVAAEFKYEPCHGRPEFLALPGKLPVVFWGVEGVAKDVARIREFVEAGAARVGFAVFVDEGRYFRHRPPHPGAAWRDWDAPRPGGLSPSVLWATWPPEPNDEQDGLSRSRMGYLPLSLY